MAYAEVKIPAMGEGIIEASIIRWLVKEGETVEKDTPLVEIATDKVDSEITAGIPGILKKILRFEGDVPRVGETIALITQPGDENMQQDFIAPTDIPEEKNNTDKTPRPVQYAFTSAEKTASFNDSGHPVLSPFVRMASKEMGISVEELVGIRGSATGNRITKKDLLQYLGLKLEQKRKEKEIEKNQQVQVSDAPPLTFNSNPSVELISISRMRKLIAEHMVLSKKNAPHATSFYEADLTTLVKWRNEHKDQFADKYGEKLTFTPLFTMAVVNALKKFPYINVSLEGENIALKKDIHLGIATVLPDGNLIVPVIHRADTFNLAELTHKINDLAARARENKLIPAEISGGTFTITNLGMFHTLTGTPIINYPESAILAIGAILRKPAVVQAPFGESIGIRNICIFSLSYDHRIIDGALAGMFLREIAAILEAWPLNKEI